MHHCFLFPGWGLSTIGGAQRLLAKEVDHLSRNGHEVTLVTSAYDEATLRKLSVYDSVSIERFETGQSTIFDQENLLARSKEINDVLVAIAPNVVHSHYMDTEAYFSTRGIDTPYVCHVNGSDFWFEDNRRLALFRDDPEFEALANRFDGHREFQNRLDISHDAAIEETSRLLNRREAIQCSVAQFTLSECVADELEFLYGVRPSVVQPGVSRSRVSPSAPCDSVGSAEHSILSIGRLDRRKRNELLLEAFEQLRERRTDVELIIAGTGPMEDHLAERVRELNLGNSVRLPGFLREEELGDAYESCDVFADPAWVAYGLTPLEAYVSGSKVAVSTDTVAGQIIRDNDGVWVARPTVERWTDILDEALDDTRDGRRANVVPTWDEYCERKFDEVADRVEA